jgi:putative tricarboxylic transport membrane protein
MFEAAVSALLQLCTPYYFILFLLGIFMGLVVGLIPGMGGSVAMALILPVTMKLDAAAALPLVMGLVSPILTSDSIPAILLGTPGSACAATVLDGYPMAQRGEAGRALGIAFAASAIGGVFGAFLIAVSIPLLKPLVLLLETPDFLALCVLAISAVSVLGGGNALKGIAAAGIGLLLAMIGEDPIRFVVRWNLGTEYLINRINIIPVAIGLFALPEILELCARGQAISHVPKQSMLGRFDGVKDTLREWKLVLSSSAIGAFTGFLPGLGSTVSTWICYSWSVIISKNKGGFGQGDFRGVVGCEAGNNASSGGSLIPTIAFGVPGSTVTALVLVVFWSVGITPGPKLLTEHVDMVFLIVWSVALANIIGAVVCYLLTNKLALITKIPPHLLAPLVFTVLVAGTLNSTGNAAGIALLIGFGILGWFMKSFGWPRPALLLAFILGPLLEKFYFQTVMIYNYTWLSRPSVIAILLCAAGLISLGVNLQKKAAASRGC